VSNSSNSKHNHIPLANDFTNWWYQGRKEILKYLISKNDFKVPINILEIGPGVGVNIEILQMYGEVDILEVDEYFIELIRENKKIEVKSIFKSFNVIDKEYDLVVFLDVLEHIENPKKFIQNIDKIMKQTGIGIISVPAYQGLFSEHDKNLKHFRRYNWSTLSNDLSSKFKIIKKFGYNFLLLPIRFIQIKIIKSAISDTIVNPIVNYILTKIVKLEVILLKLNIKSKFGLSLFAVIKKINA
tara:strand:- start:81 stop:806 length:726 start_codon:yes stop_codon:yes gene_type:complete